MNKQQIGSLIADKRQNSGLTNWEILKATGLSASQITAIEGGEKAYTIDSLEKICGLFKLELDIKQSE